MWKQRRNRVLNSGAQLAQITSSVGYRRFAIFQEEVIEITVRVNERQLTCADVQGKLVCVSTKLHFRSDKPRHFGDGSRSMMSNREVLRYEVPPRQHAANSYCSKHAIRICRMLTGRH